MLNFYPEDQLIDRSNLLSFGTGGWMNNDPEDPTNNYPPESFGILWYLTQLHGQNVNPEYGASYQGYLHKFGWGLLDENQVIDVSYLAPYGYSQGTMTRELFPDYKLDGLVALVRPDGTSIPIMELKVAAEYAATYGNIFVNGSLSSYLDAKASAQLFSASIQEPIVWMYHAQSIDYWNEPNPDFMARLDDLTKFSSEAAVQ